jgi:hypothetical protein
MTGQLYGGLPANINLATSVAIASSTNANPIQITTAAIHRLRTGDVVDIGGHTLNLPANCVGQVVTVVDGLNFTIPIDGTGAAAGGATGTVQPLAYTRNIATLPADGDAYAAASYVPGFAADLDRSAFTLGTIGNKKLVQLLPYYGAGPLSPVAARVATPVNGSPIVFLSGPGFANAIAWRLTRVALIDHVEVNLEGSVAITYPNAAAIDAVFTLYWSLLSTGVATPTVLAGFTNQEANSQRNIQFSAIAGGAGSRYASYPISISAQLVGAFALPGTQTVGDLVVTLAGTDRNGATNFDLQGAYNMTLRQWRPTGVSL